MEYLRINARRDGYTPEQCDHTMTVGELVEFLSDYDSELPVYLSHDNGYTYGPITDYDIDEASFSEDEDEEESEDEEGGDPSSWRNNNSL